MSFIQFEGVGYNLLGFEPLALKGKNIDHLGFRCIGFMQLLEQLAGIDLI